MVNNFSKTEVTPDGLSLALSWDIDKNLFRKQIEDLITLALKNDKSIPIPVPFLPGEFAFGQLAFLNLIIDCNKCPSICCKMDFSEGHTDSIELTDEDRKRFDKYGIKYSSSGGLGTLPLPCPYLKSNRCSIYEIRPTVCMIFPFQPGGYIDNIPGFSLCSGCPQMRHLALKIYLKAYELKNRLQVEMMSISLRSTT